jgi:hypothetical protein
VKRLLHTKRTWCVSCMLTELYPVRVISAQRMRALIATFCNAVLSVRLVGGAEHTSSTTDMQQTLDCANAICGGR